MSNQRKGWMFLSFFTLSSLGLMGLLSLPAQPVSAADTQTQPKITEIAATEIGNNPAQDIIRQQLSAIKTRDADLAFSLTTKEFHSKFDDASNFFGHMRFEYRPLYNYATFKFLDSHVNDGNILQKVRVEDHYGDDPAIVIFRLEEQDDGQWLIDSFTILDTEAQPI